MVAEAAVVLGDSLKATVDRADMLRSAQALGEGAALALAEPSKLHGVDQLMRGHAQAVSGDAGVEPRRLADDAATAAAA